MRVCVCGGEGSGVVTTVSWILLPLTIIKRCKLNCSGMAIFAAHPLCLVKAVLQAAVKGGEVNKVDKYEKGGKTTSGNGQA